LARAAGGGRGGGGGGGGGGEGGEGDIEAHASDELYTTSRCTFFSTMANKFRAQLRPRTLRLAIGRVLSCASRPDSVPVLSGQTLPVQMLAAV